ncbi:hypothetical protein B9Z55_003276 [Caenorhabditis nigoni]|uniref:Uncharacterized protein n=1 Tax=Caenorhabditis nigoni TaxID=1611254 RepID=A0A2G5VPG5_9PELO|nr:hypothetical protein B9Z55_003276 [Caenorhabditis nigoni]
MNFPKLSHVYTHFEALNKKSILSFAYVIISILMVLLWSMYLCIDGRRNPKKDTRVIHMLAQNAFFRSVP